MVSRVYLINKYGVSNRNPGIFFTYFIYFSVMCIYESFLGHHVITYLLDLLLVVHGHGHGTKVHKKSTYFYNVILLSASHKVAMFNQAAVKNGGNREAS